MIDELSPNLPPALRNVIRASLLRIHAKKKDGAEVADCLKEAYDVLAQVLKDSGQTLSDQMLNETIPAWILRWAVFHRWCPDWLLLELGTIPPAARANSFPFPQPSLVRVASKWVPFGDYQAPADSKAYILRHLESRIAYWLADALENSTFELARPRQEASSSLPTISATSSKESPEAWASVEVSFTSDNRIQIRNGPNSPTYNYGDLGFADRRTGNPNQAWKTFRELAIHNGVIKNGASTRQSWSKVEKRIQEIRKILRERLHISADPIPFVEGVGYQARFKIGCAPSFET